METKTHKVMNILHTSGHYRQIKNKINRYVNQAKEVSS